MCRFASFVLTKDKVFWLPDSESHSEIICRHKIHESGVRGLNVVKVEILPPDGRVDLAAVEDIDSWRLTFDQDQFPDWHDRGESDRRARSKLHEKLKNLTTLDASYSNIVDVSALKNLTTLDASYSNIVDVSALKNLTTLYASGSKIVDVSALKNLTTLYASGSKIVDVSALKNRGCLIL